MFLTRLIYASKASEGVTQEDLNKILASAQKNNGEVDVTGILIFSHKYFLQVLEGGRSQVNSIYQKILNDERHHDPMLIDYSETSERLFTKWDMKLFMESTLNRQQNLKFSSNEKFDPFDMSSDSALAFLKEISSR